MSDHDFTRTSCACDRCVRLCKKQPGPLAPGDFERIAAHLSEDHETAKQHFWASPGCLIKSLATGKVTRIGTITPRYRKGRCVFLDENDRCKIHEVSPFGCSYFDAHMSDVNAQERGSWLANQQQHSVEYQALRNSLTYATHHKPTRYQ